MRSIEPASPQQGFTLLEVLVALVIIGLGLIAVFGQLNQSLMAVGVLRDKTFAQWVAIDRITELRVLGEFPDVGERSDTLEMAGVEWAYTMSFSDVGVPDFRRVDVTVSFADQRSRPLVTAYGFLARPQDDGGTATLPGGWFNAPAEEPDGALQ